MSARYTEEWLTERLAKQGVQQNRVQVAQVKSQQAGRVQPKHDYKAEFVHQCWIVGIRLQPEFKIFDDRKFKADWRVADTKILVEFEGGLFRMGKRGHNSVTGILRDIEKYNLCALAGWIVIRITPKHIVSGQALQWVEQAISRAS